MKKNKILLDELKLVEALIKKDLSKEKTIVGLYKYIFKSNGKKIRARLNLIASSKTKKNNRIKLASVIELLHTATLVHDDVVDNSPTRRGIKSVNNLWTNSHGVLIGDYIYSKAFMYMVDIGNKKILKELANATNDISQGELIQLDAIKNTNITLNKLQKISYFKTGRLFEAAARTGAINSNENKLFISNISECAKNLGILFQIKDDLLDYSHDKKIGKPIFQDIKEGKVTYPFYYAYKNANTKQKKYLKELLGIKRKISKKDIDLIKGLDGIQKTKALANQYHNKSIMFAKKIKNIYIRQEMIELANIALNRDI
ncbi:MAG: dimethylallyltransferase [Gammaproteobacteria bacterium]|nr:dimethylallyltransferase [Gammaproteobacteria bacterium]